MPDNIDVQYLKQASYKVIGTTKESSCLDACKSDDDCNRFHQTR